jgi:hypothetical protein
MTTHPVEAFKEAISGNDLATVRQLFEAHPEAAEHIDAGIFNWGMPALAASQSPEMVGSLIEKGASVDEVSKWWAPGFGASQVLPEIAQCLIERGATVSPHAVSGIGLVEELAEMLNGDSELVHAPGGDGCHPLHFAQCLPVAKLLVDRGADLNARDEDHESTPVQWRIKDAP